MLTVVPGADGSDEPCGHESTSPLGPALIDELVREGARRMLASALQAEVDDYIDRHTGGNVSLFRPHRDGLIWVHLGWPARLV